jgi:DNA-binding NtrC family response regulator
VDFRLISATHRNLEEEVARRRFRADLFYRIHVLTVHIPPLRERREDIPFLVHHFVKLHSREKKLKIPRIPSDTMDTLCTFDYPGNARELSSLLEKAMLLAGGETLRIEHLGPPQKDRIRKKTLKEAKEDLEKEMIRTALKRAGGKITAAAARLGIHRQQLHRLMRKYDIP